MAWSSKFVILVLTITWTYATQMPEPKNCTVKEHLQCLLYEPSDCRPESLQTLFPDIYNDTAMFPGQTGSFNGEIGYMNRSSNNVTYSQVNLTFTPAQSAAMFLTKGFEVTQLKEGFQAPKCFIFDLGNAKWKDSDMNTIFTLIRGPLQPDKLHYYELFALPKPFVEYDVYRYVQVDPKGSFASDTPIRWRPYITTKLYPAEKRILVRFSSPPEKFGFDSYNVKLYNDSTGAVSAKFDRIQETYINFTKVEPGNYSIWVQPHDPYWNAADITKCLCHDAVCEPCRTTKTSVFEMEYVIDCGPPPPLYNGYSNYTSTVYNSEAVYSCYAGFTPVTQEPVRICLADAIWSTQVIICVPETCPNPGIPVQGTMATGGGAYTQGSMVTYICRQGYTLSVSAITITKIPNRDVVLNTKSPAVTSFLCHSPAFVEVYNMKILRKRESDSDFSTIAHVRVNDPHNRTIIDNGVSSRATVSLGIDTNTTTNSQLKLEFVTQQIKCTDVGSYKCVVTYANASGATVTDEAGTTLSVYALPYDISLVAKDSNGITIVGTSDNPKEMYVGDTIEFSCSAKIGSDNTTALRWKKTDQTSASYIPYNPPTGWYDDGTATGPSNCTFTRTATMRYNITTLDAYRQYGLAFQCYIQVSTPTGLYSVPNPQTFHIKAMSAITITKIPTRDVVLNTQNPAVTSFLCHSPDFVEVYNMKILRKLESDSDFSTIAHVRVYDPHNRTIIDSDVSSRATVSLNIDNNTATNSQLKLEFVTQQIECTDVGSYKCVVTYANASGVTVNDEAGTTLSVYALPHDISLEAKDSSGVTIVGTSSNPKEMNVGDTVEFSCSAKIGSDNSTTLRWEITSPTSASYIPYNPPTGWYDEGTATGPSNCTYTRTATMRHNITTLDAYRHIGLAFRCYIQVSAPTGLYSVPNPPTFHIKAKVKTTMHICSNETTDDNQSKIIIGVVSGLLCFISGVSIGIVCQRWKDSMRASDKGSDYLTPISPSGVSPATPSYETPDFRVTENNRMLTMDTAAQENGPYMELQSVLHRDNGQHMELESGLHQETGQYMELQSGLNRDNGQSFELQSSLRDSQTLVKELVHSNVSPN